MEHFYKKIYGFFDYEELYTNVIGSLPNNSHIVEIGSYMGCSTAYLAVEIINSKKNIKLDVVDSWNGEDGTGRPPWSDYGDDPTHNVSKPSGDIFESFKRNLEPVWSVINPIQSLSDKAADLYKDNSLDFVFIDANHHYEGVKQDIVKWLPKVKNNGIIAGHDYNPISWPGVIKAVHECFPENKIKVIGASWIVNI